MSDLERLHLFFRIRFGCFVHGAENKTLQPINIRTLSYYSHHASFMAFHLYTSTLSLSLSLEQQQQQQ